MHDLVQVVSTTLKSPKRALRVPPDVVFRTTGGIAGCSAAAAQRTAGVHRW